MSEENGVIKLRNYVPDDEKSFQHTKIEAAKVPEPEAEPLANEEAEAGEEELDDEIIDVAPKRENLDLKRDVAAKLEKLERRTQNAMIELMREEEEARQKKLLS